MGSGEPLDNYDNVTKFIELVNADYNKYWTKTYNYSLNRFSA